MTSYIPCILILSFLNSNPSTQSLPVCETVENKRMSLCVKEGKDVIIFATKEDHSTPSTVNLPPLDPQPGLILPNGDINWNCPCLGGMATGPCGVEFREAFSCFHYSEADPKGSDCLEVFTTMQNCMQQYPGLYDKYDKKDDDTVDEEGSMNMMGIGEEQNSSVNSVVPDKVSIDAEHSLKK